MPNPNRKKPLPIMASGFCRHEVQKVLRRHYKSDPTFTSAYRLLSIFWLLRSAINYPDEKIDIKDVRSHQLFTVLLSSVKEYPELVGELLIAFKESDARMQSLPKNSPERIIEDSYAELILDENKILNEALPSLFQSQLAQVRTRLSISKRTVMYWINSVSGPLSKSKPPEMALQRKAVMESLRDFIWLYQKSPKS